MNNMRELRKQKGLTMKELGKAVGVAESTISLYENGKHEPDLTTMKRIADVLEVSIDELIDYKTDETIDEEIYAIRDRYRSDPAFRLLFDASKNATSEHMKAAAAMLKALEPDDNGGYYPDE